MAGTVGEIACDAVRSRPGLQVPQERIEVYSPVGVDGFGTRRVGIGESPFTFELFKQDVYANVIGWYDAIAQLKIGPITIVDDWGSTHTNMQITAVTPLSRIPAIRGALVLVSGTFRIRGVQTEVQA